ncbi:MAG: D-alanyl-D-alanine carboxypeptidase/D-alanyl-D-alanine-endopeptidase [Planctomycetes bacterium]|nr:D-alanyl-D-alanine carboxypeptidase/D-alanyl-D-alanine-endopeptidase [Planctomycetota bacterium]
MIRLNRLATLLLAAVSIPPVAGLEQEKGLHDQLDAAAQGLKIKGAKVGIVIYSVKAGHAVYGMNENEPLLLASNTKLLTTSAALCRLGADFKFRTSVGVIGDDLHVFAGGDPNLSCRFHDDDPTAIFKEWAGKIKAAGVTRAGRLVLHTGIFDDVHLHPGWKSYDLWNWWAAPFGALSLNDNCVDLRVAPAAEGQPCKVSLSPDTAFITVLNQTKSAAKAARSTYSISRGAENSTITLRGEVAGRNLNWVAVHDPARYFGTVLKETLAQGGVEIAGAVEESAQLLEEAKGYRELASWESDLPATLTACNHPSQNFYAEMIFRTLAWKTKGRGTTENAIEAVREFLTKDAGLEEVSQADGSGLTRENRATPSQIVKLLIYMRQHKQGKVFIDSLPSNGDKKGTLKNRLLAPDLKGRIRAKTGHIGGVSTLSGYVESAGGDTFVFSILSNAGEQVKMGLADQIEDRLCEILARHKGD